MDADAMKDLVRRLADAMNSRQLDQLDAIMADDFVRHCEATPGLEVKSRDDFKAFLRADDRGVSRQRADDDARGRRRRPDRRLRHL